MSQYEIRRGRDGWWYRRRGSLFWIGPFKTEAACIRACNTYIDAGGKFREGTR